MVFEDCPICLDPMSSTDFDHPLQCNRHCGYNFCKNCISSLITSSKDDYMEASDGNLHVKVFLLCPNCRSDLSTTIRDTLLLRKTDEILNHCRMVSAARNNSLVQVDGGEEKSSKDKENKQSIGVKGGANEDEGLTESQLRFKAVMDQEKIQAAIRNARKLEAEYLGRPLEDIVEEQTDDDDDDDFAEDNGFDDDNGHKRAVGALSVNHEEHGLEMDLRNGVHKSVRVPLQPEPEEAVQEKFTVDPSLFSGLDYFLTDEEREEITELMTSGDPNKLSDAAEVLHFVALNSLNPERQQRRRRSSSTFGRKVRRESSTSSAGSSSTSSVRSRRSLKRRCSVFDLISESEAAHAKKELGDKIHPFPNTPFSPLSTINSPNSNCGSNSGHKSPRVRAAEHRRFDSEIKKSAEFQKMYPIPVRMPKCIKIDLTESFELQFVDYEWDGTVLDAYSKITIGFRGKIDQKKQHRWRHSDAGVRTVLGGDNDVRIELPHQPRVLISNVGRSAGRQGVMRGDVITHIGGDAHDMSAGKLLMHINGMRQRGLKSLYVTVNAERSVAEALRRRALAIKDHIDGKNIESKENDGIGMLRGAEDDDLRASTGTCEAIPMPSAAGCFFW